MNLFSKEKLLKIAGAAKKHFVLFVPVLLMLIIGYFLFSIVDAIQILALHIRNLFLTIVMLCRRAVRGIALFFVNIAKSMGNAAARRSKKMSDGWHCYCENAATARNQLLNGAVDYCADKAQRRYDKKQRLNKIAKELRDGGKHENTEVEISAPEPKIV